MFACNNSKLIYENVIVLQNVYQQVMTKASGVYLHLKEKEKLSRQSVISDLSLTDFCFRILIICSCSWSNFSSLSTLSCRRMFS